MKYLLIAFFPYQLMASDVMDLGNLDIKGNLNLPSYSLDTDILTLDSSLMKIASIEYKKDAVLDSKKDYHLPQKKKMLFNDNDFRFDIKIKKVSLE